MKELDDDGNTIVNVAKKSIRGGTVKVICSSALENNETVSNIDLYSGTLLEVGALGGVIDSNIFKFASGASGAIANFYFNTNVVDDNTYFMLYPINNNSSNTIVLGSDAYKTNTRLGFNELSNNFSFGENAAGATTYKFVNAVINLLDEKNVFKDVAPNISDFNTYSFAYLDVDENTVIKLDLDLATTDQYSVSDKIQLLGVLTDNDGNPVEKVMKIFFNITEPSKISDETSRVIQILTGAGAASYSIEIANDPADIKWTYSVGSYINDGNAQISYDTFMGTKQLAAFDNNGDGKNDSVELISDQEDTLRAVNVYEYCDIKYFNFRTNEDPKDTVITDERVYELIDNLGVTKKQLNIVGINKLTSIIDAGGNKTLDGGVDEGYTMFQVTHASTILNISDVTIKNAVLGKGGENSEKASVLYITGANSNVTLTNVVFTNNEGVIDIDADKDIENATAAAIYNSSNLYMTNVTFNSATNSDIANNIINDGGTISINSTEGNANTFASYITNTSTGRIIFESDSYSDLRSTLINDNENAQIIVDTGAELAMNMGARILLKSGRMNVYGQIISNSGTIAIDKGATLTLRGEGSKISDYINIKVAGNLVIDNNTLPENNSGEINYGLVLGSGDSLLNHASNPDEKVLLHFKITVYFHYAEV